MELDAYKRPIVVRWHLNSTLLSQFEDYKLDLGKKYVKNLVYQKVFIVIDYDRCVIKEVQFSSVFHVASECLQLSYLPIIQCVVLARAHIWRLVSIIETAKYHYQAFTMLQIISFAW